MEHKEMRLTKRILMILFCVITMLSAIPVYAYSETTEQTSITVGVPVDRCPIFYLDAETGETVGIGVDLMRAAAEKAGLSVSFKRIEEETLKDALDNDAYDVLMPFGSAITSTTGHATVVSDNLFQTPFTLVTKGNQTLPPLNELRVGMLRSLSGGAETVRQLFPGIEIAFFGTMSECVKALRADMVDALLHNSYVWSYVLQKPSYSDLVVQPLAMFSMDFRAGALDTPDGRAIIERLNSGIGELPDTLRQAIVLDHTTRSLYQYDFYDYLYVYGLILLLGMLLSVAIVAIIVLKWRAVRKEHEEKLRWLTDHDQLAGALSLNGFRKRVEDLLRVHPDTPYLLSYINFKNFKYINESLGRASGDALLRFYVDSTKNHLSNEEALCRIEADHFAVLSRAEGDDGLRKGNQTVLDSVRNYFVDRGKGHQVQICGGIYVLTPEDYQKINVDQMLDYARVAEKKVRDTHKDGYAFYNPEQWVKGKRVADFITHLPLAIQAGELHVWYQPQIDFETGKITGAEALCRWNHGKLGWLRPAEFIPILEEAGLIYDLDCFVWDRVCQDLQRWNKQGIRRSVSVNLSRSDIHEDRNIPGQFYDLINTYELTADQLRIEITETTMMTDVENRMKVLEDLRKEGFIVEMDDFGSGYSSLNLLKDMPVDVLKIDMQFLTASADEEKGRTILQNIIQLSEELGMFSLTEGVETKSQMEMLADMGCKLFQGYYFAKPLPLPEFDDFFKTALA